jgi:hypothetical protein
VAAREFTQHMASVPQAEAQILKQARLLREELLLKKEEDPAATPTDPGSREGDGRAPRGRGKKS